MKEIKLFTVMFTGPNLGPTWNAADSLEEAAEIAAKLFNSRSPKKIRKEQILDSFNNGSRGIAIKRGDWEISVEEKFGAWLKARRETLGLTQEDIATIVGVSANTIARWERGVMFPRSIGAIKIAIESISR